ncbi:hypothetical protein ACFPRL_01445 [Pseudoclavibacter helvolus]
MRNRLGSPRTRYASSTSPIAAWASGTSPSIHTLLARLVNPSEKPRCHPPTSRASSAGQLARSAAVARSSDTGEAGSSARILRSATMLRG